jgi:nitronate monooxygenase
MEKISERLNIQYPIIQAPMALADSPALAAAISNCGGLGSLGGALFTPEQLREKIQEIRSLTQKPFSINLFAPTDTKKYSKEEINHALIQFNYFRKKLGLKELKEIELKPEASFEEKLHVIIEEKVPVFSFTFGVLSEEVIKHIKSYGIKIIGTATTVREAKALEKNGVDFITAQGYEAGGHRGTDLKMTSIQDALIGTMVLVPQMVDAVKIPVIASGGIMDARGIAAAFVLGASAVQIGTAFLGCPESSIHPAHRKCLLQSTEEDTCITNVFSGRFARSIKNAFLSEMEENHFPILDYPIQLALVKDIRDAAKKQNNPEYMSLWSGQGGRLCKNKPAAEVFQELISETNEILKKMKNFIYLNVDVI